MSGARPKTPVAGEAVQESQQQEVAQKQDAQQQDAQQQDAQREFLKAEAKLTEQLGKMLFAFSREKTKKKKKKKKKKKSAESSEEEDEDDEDDEDEDEEDKGIIEYIYNPLIYAINPHTDYVNKYFGLKKVLFTGMNPRPNGMAQNGVPFGDGYYVRDWLMIQGDLVKSLPTQHPNHPILGLDCKKREVRGSRFWEHMMEVFCTMENFFQLAYVHNYCPLLFLDDDGRNVVPGKLALTDRKKLEEHCDECLLRCINIMKPEVIVPIGVYAEEKVNKMLKKAIHAKKINADYAKTITLVMIFHPSKATRKAESTLVLQQLLNGGGAVPDRQQLAAQLKFVYAEAILTKQLNAWEVNFMKNVEYTSNTSCKHIYNPLTYAIIPHTDYVNRYFGLEKVLFLGMNPGPTGTAQNGVPFGDAHYVHKWMGIVELNKSVLKKIENLAVPPPHPVLNPDCKSESGARFWRFMMEKFGTMAEFSRHAYVHNYCPLLFLKENGTNFTPEELNKSDRTVVESHCDELLWKILEIMQPKTVVAIGGYAETRVNKVLERNVGSEKVVKMLHPSPRNCKKYDDYATIVFEQLKDVLPGMKHEEEPEDVTNKETLDVGAGLEKLKL